MNKSQPFCKRKKTTSLIAITAILIGFAITIPKLVSLKKNTEPMEMGQVINYATA